MNVKKKDENVVVVEAQSSEVGMEMPTEVRSVGVIRCHKCVDDLQALDSFDDEHMKKYMQPEVAIINGEHIVVRCLRHHMIIFSLPITLPPVLKALVESEGEHVCDDCKAKGLHLH